MEEKRIEPLSNVVPIWDKGCGGYPSRIKVAMANGRIETFWRNKPVIIHPWRPWRPKLEIIGYPQQDEYQPKHLKRPAVLEHQPATEQNFR